MYFFVTAAWLTVTIVSFYQGNRKIPIIMGSLGLAAQLGIWTAGIGFIGVIALVILTIIGMFSAPEIFFPSRS